MLSLLLGAKLANPGWDGIRCLLQALLSAAGQRLLFCASPAPRLG